MKMRSGILKLALFATGLAGIVSEYVLSTLATYFLGDSVFQWTMIVSIMLFSMGLGSRLSKWFTRDLLMSFITIEFVLSLLTAFSSVIAYWAFLTFEGNGIAIYVLSILIGLLIGMEIPLVIRLNESFEELRINVSSVMEKDYYGSLAGGMFFAFIGLPYIGLTYTPFILGGVNFLVACTLIVAVFSSNTFKIKRNLVVMTGVVLSMLIVGVITGQRIVESGESSRYRDPVVYSAQSKYQRIVITKNEAYFWLFINGNQQLSSLDEHMYHEPLVHPVMALSGQPSRVMVMGGGDGGAVREILKYPSVEEIVLVDLDPVMTDLGKNNPLLTEMNENALNNEKVSIINTDGFNYLEKNERFFDVIIVDLPDPKTVELNRLYSKEFYELCYKRLTANGQLITQAGSPYYAEMAFRCIDITMNEAGFSTQMLHNQVTTLGEWGWVLGAKNMEESALRNRLLNLNFDHISTRWINQEAMGILTSFGKSVFDIPISQLKVNTIQNPVLYRYYLDGRWDVY